MPSRAGGSVRWVTPVAAPAFQGSGRVLALSWPHVCPVVGVELLVAGEEVGAFGLQPGEEDVLHLVAEVEGYAAQEGRAGLAGSLDDRADLVGAVVDAGHQWGDEDAGVDAAPAQLGDRVEASAGAGGVRLGRAPRVLVEGRHREVDRDGQVLRHPLVDVDVAHDQRRLGQHRDRRLGLLQRRQDLRHHPVAALDPLVGVGVRTQRHQLPLPARPRQLRPQPLRHVDLDDDLALEVPAGVEIQIGVSSSSEAKNASMSTSSVLVDRVAEPVAAAGHLVQGRAGADLVEVDAHRLGGVEGPHDGAVADSRQPQVVLDSLLVPTHANTCSHRRWTDGLDAGAGLVAPEGLELTERFGTGFGAQGWQQGDQVAGRAQRLLRPAAEVEVVDVVGDPAVLGEAELRLDVVDHGAAGGEGVAGDPVGRAGLLAGLVLVQLDLQVGGAPGQHPPHRADLVSLEIAERRVVKMGPRGVAGGHRGAVAFAERRIEALDRRAVGLGGHVPTLRAIGGAARRE